MSDKNISHDMEFFQRKCGKSRLKHIRNKEIRQNMKKEKSVIEGTKRKARNGMTIQRGCNHIDGCK